VHVTVGTHTRIAEEIPGPSDVVTGFENRERTVRTIALEKVGGADSGDAGTDHHDVEMLERHDVCLVHVGSGPTPYNHGVSNPD
jgi:hypothetical protein